VNGPLSDDPRLLLGIEVRPNGVTLRLDDGEVLDIAPAAMPPELPAVGGNVSSPLLAALREAAARKRAAKRLFEILGRRLWPRAHLERILCGEGLPAGAVAAVLDEAAAQGLHSDRQYAEAYCRDAVRSRLVGRAWLQAKLREKGIAGELASAVAAAQLTPDQELELACRAARQRWRRERAADRLALARVQRFLAARGFPTAVCRQAALAAKPQA
jgi:regulatory protein